MAAVKMFVSFDRFQRGGPGYFNGFSLPGKTLLVSSKKNTTKQQQLEAAGAEVWILPDGNGGVDFSALAEQADAPLQMASQFSRTGIESAEPLPAQSKEQRTHCNIDQCKELTAHLYSAAILMPVMQTTLEQ